MPVPKEQEEKCQENGEALALVGKTFPFKSLVQCDLRQFTRR